jgi:hypothetical protein
LQLKGVAVKALAHHRQIFVAIAKKNHKMPNAKQTPAPVEYFFSEWLRVKHGE